MNLKAFAVSGKKNSGKTTTVENIIKELRNQNYTVGSVKDIHDNVEFDKEGSDTDRHKKAGAQLVTARGVVETDLMFQRRLELDEILNFYSYDYVVLEGFKSFSLPKILCAKSLEEIDELMDKDVFAVSGLIAEKIEEYKGCPVINSIDDVEKLVQLIKDKVGDWSKDMSDYQLTLSIGGKDIAMLPFVQNILLHGITGMLSQLKGYTQKGDIMIKIRR
ncbi:molybdopterin-guanine dinucleotide biosynthesis protein B [Aceticella autotrophica]|uniref:molybdopterin-guanine dinucleotide biosynthesis protein B n=1 Tax=Aceticella autotrophica TaxID=2755338 RepID=UPI0025429748|nr:molybdopterin-guanine dinucleotide biosynthesis protein B [Aceticella autotrophica]